MSGNFMGFGYMLFYLPIVAGQWVGVLGLGKAERNRAWWLMMSGICCTTLGTIGSSLFIALIALGQSPMTFGNFSLISAGTPLGSLLFAIGFAVYGLQASKARQRITELEAIAAAQGEELNRQRASYPSAS